MDSRFGVAKGFDVFDDRFRDDEMIKTFRSERRAGETTAAFLRWLDGRPAGPFFSWIHYYDPHTPYDPPSPFKEDFASNPYHGEIAYMDSCFAKVLERLREKGLLEKTLIVIVGDHGEAMGEREELGHGVFIYDVTMKVPLLFHAPRNLPKGLVVDSRVRLIDIMPTVLDALKMPVGGVVQGTSLLPYMEGREKDSLPCYLESYYPLETYGWSELVGLIEGDWKFIRAPRPELYDLKTDPRRYEGPRPETGGKGLGDDEQAHGAHRREFFQPRPQPEEAQPGRGGASAVSRLRGERRFGPRRQRPASGPQGYDARVQYPLPGEDGGVGRKMGRGGEGLPGDGPPPTRRRVALRRHGDLLIGSQQAPRCH